MTVATGLTALSNMPVIGETKSDDGSTVTYTYSTTPIMSTYLLAFVIGELERVSDITRDGVEVNVYTTPGKKEEGLFGLDVACETLAFFAEYFATPYPLPKADLVAIPDFAAGAMENWGLITFRETALLVSDVRPAC
jgi:aminopeptidase N